MKLQMLISAVEQNSGELPEKMNLRTPAVIVDQCDRYAYEEHMRGEDRIQCFCMSERGVGLSRNTALLHADADVCIFSDEDIVYADDYAEKIRKAYEELPEADLILFNVKVSPARKTYWNEDIHRVTYRNYGRYPAYSITGKLDAFRRANVSYSLLFGGGAKYSNGEDSLFLRDCLRAGLRIYTHTDCIGEEKERESTWFHGYNEKFFRDRGVLYHFLYGRLARVLSLRFVWVHKQEMCRQIPVKKAYRLMKDGIREGKNG